MSRIRKVEVHVFQFDAPNLVLAGGGAVGALHYAKGGRRASPSTRSRSPPTTVCGEST